MQYAQVSINGNLTVVAISKDRESYALVMHQGKVFTGDMVEWIHISSHGDCSNSTQFKPLSEVQLLAPVFPRRNIFCVGKNYREHAKEFQQSGFDSSSKDGETVPPHPVVFTKAPSSIIAHGDRVDAHAHITSQLDYEAELAVVIGKAGKGISQADAWNYVYGYTIVNDVTARDLQHQHRQWFLGKSIDTFCPMGPWITTADSIDATNLSIQCHVNQELRQNANTKDLIFDIPHLIQTISAVIALQPGDVIATGTPAGVGLGFQPPKFLTSGDIVSVEIEGIGRLVNSIQ